ncbi:MAG: glycosyltransferase family 87 protein [Rhodospirillales bacterium]
MTAGRVGLWLAVAGVAAHGVLPALAVLRTLAGDPGVRIVDLPSFFYAAQAAFNLGLSPYDPFTIAHYAEILGQRVYPFLYPPAALPAFYPLSLVGYPVAAALVLAVNLALTGWLTAWLYRRYLAGVPSRAVRVVAMLALVAFDPITQTLLKGQVNLAVLALVVWGADRPAAARGEGTCGIALGLATVLKTYPAVLLAVFLARRRYAVVAAAAATWAALAGLSLLFLPADLWRQWLGEVAPSATYAATPFGLLPPGYPSNQGLNGFFARLFAAPQGAAAATWLGSAAVAAATAWALWLRRAVAAPAFVPYAVALTLAAIVLVAPLAWLHHHVFLLPALLLLLRQAPSRPQRALALALLVVLALPFNLLVHMFAAVVPVPTVAVAALWLCLLAAPPRPASAPAPRMAPAPLS